MERFLSVVAQIPEIRAEVPWSEFIKIYVDAIDLGDLKAKIGANDTLSKNTQMQALLSQFQGGGSGQGLQGPAGDASNAELAGSEIQ